MNCCLNDDISWLYIGLIVNKSYEDTKTNDVLACFTALTSSTLSAALSLHHIGSHWIFRKLSQWIPFKKKDSVKLNLNQLVTVDFN